MSGVKDSPKFGEQGFVCLLCQSSVLSGSSLDDGYKLQCEDLDSSSAFQSVRSKA